MQAKAYSNEAQWPQTPVANRTPGHTGRQTFTVVHRALSRFIAQDPRHCDLSLSLIEKIVRLACSTSLRWRRRHNVESRQTCNDRNDTLPEEHPSPRLVSSSGLLREPQVDVVTHKDGKVQRGPKECQTRGEFLTTLK